MNNNTGSGIARISRNNIINNNIIYLRCFSAARKILIRKDLQPIRY